MITENDVREWVGAAAFQRGKTYFREGRVLLVSVDAEENGDLAVEARVQGSRRQPYRTAFLFQDDLLFSECSCPVEFDCKHGAAVALAYLASAVERPGPSPLLPFPTAPVPAPPRSWRERLASDLAGRSPLGRWRYQPVLRVVPAVEGASLQVCLSLRNGAELLAVPWAGVSFPAAGQTPEALWLRELLQWRQLEGWDRLARRRPAEPAWFSIPPQHLTACLQRLALCPELFLEDGTRAFVHPQEPIEGGFELERREERIVLSPAWRSAAGPVSAAELVRLPGAPSDWAVRDGRHFHPLAQAPGPAIEIPAEEVAAFEREFLPALAVGGLLSGRDAPQDVRVLPGEPVGQLLIGEADGEAGSLLSVRAGFRYGPERVEAHEALTLLGPPEGPFCTRDERKEQEWLLGFRRHAPEAYGGRLVLRTDEALDFVAKALPKLLKEGWEVLGEELLQRYRVTTSRARASLSVSSGIDWFDVKGEVTVGKEPVPWESLQRALLEGRRYVLLGSGAHAKLPEKWLKAQVQLLSALRAKPEALAEGLRVARHQAPVVAQLLAHANVAKVDAAWEAFIEKLRTFGGIEEAPVPEGFEGELRPYQQRGLSFLSFLRDYGLHGVLADDMGLGKTVQAAAFLAASHGAGAGAPSLVVAPTSLLENWRSELARFAPGLRVRVLHGPSRDVAALTDCDVAITTYATARLDLERHRAREYHALLLDEAQAIKNPLSQTAAALGELRARHRLCLTGTPVENNLVELWSLFQFLMPGLLGTQKEFKQRYALPIAAGNQEAAAELKARVSPFMLRRLKQEVAPELPPRTDMVVWCELEPAQRRVYETVLAASRARVEAALADKGLERSRITILDALLKLRQACCHPALLKAPETLQLGSGKLAAFLELVEELTAGGHRALVFSQFTGMLAILKAALDERGVAYEYLDGKTKDRAARVRRFNEGTAPLFLISLKAGGTGLNLTGADYVIHYDPWWNPAAEDQATDRAHRIGQTRHVFNYKLIAKGTIEEKLLALQEKKRELVRGLLEADQAGKQLTAEDLAFLFEAPAAGRRRG